MARIAANGVRPGAVALGIPVEVGACSVVMTDVGPGLAAFREAARAGRRASFRSRFRPRHWRASKASYLKVGETMRLSDKLRVFLLSVDPEAGTARGAIYGTGLTTLALALPHQAGDSILQLIGLEGRTATVGGGC